MREIILSYQLPGHSKKSEVVEVDDDTTEDEINAMYADWVMDRLGRYATWAEMGGIDG